MGFVLAANDVVSLTLAVMLNTGAIMRMNEPSKHDEVNTGMDLRMRHSAVSLATVGLLSAAVALATLGTGCGNKGDASASSNPRTPAPITSQASQPAEPQADRQLSFSEVVPKCKTVSNGKVANYRFSYADRDGAIHCCELPRVMSEGKWTWDAWMSTFQAYDVHPKAVQHTARHAGQVDISDFPFVSPRSGAAGTARAVAQEQAVRDVQAAQAATESQQPASSDQADKIPKRAELVQLATKTMKEKLGDNWQIGDIRYNGNQSQGAAIVMVSDMPLHDMSLTFAYSMGRWRCTC